MMPMAPCYASALLLAPLSDYFTPQMHDDVWRERISARQVLFCRLAAITLIYAAYAITIAVDMMSALLHTILEKETPQR